MSGGVSIVSDHVLRTSCIRWRSTNASLLFPDASAPRNLVLTCHLARGSVWSEQNHQEQSILRGNRDWARDQIEGSDTHAGNSARSESCCGRYRFRDLRSGGYRPDFSTSGHHLETSSCSHNSFGVRLGVSEIAPSAYPTFEIRCKLRGLRVSRGGHGACYSNPGLGFELVTLKTPLALFAHGPRASNGKWVQARAQIQV